MKQISLKYRIALIIMLLEAIMVSLVLWRVQSVSYEEVTSKLKQHKEIYLGLLSDMGRNALITTEYGELQHYVDKLEKLVSVEKIILSDHRSVVVVSSDHNLLSKTLPVLDDDEYGRWKVKGIALESGDEAIGRIHIKFSNSDIRAAYRKSIIHGITVAGISMAAIAFAGLMIGYLLVRRLEKLNKAAMKMAEGNLDIPAEISGSDEIAQLGETFNVMAQKIRLSMDTLKQSEKGLQEAQRVAHFGSWQWTTSTDTVKWSEELYRIYERDPKLPPPNYTEMSSDYAPESWKRLSEAVERALRSGASYELDLEIIRPDGTTKYTTVWGEAEHDADGKITGLHGSVQDTTERKKAEDRIFRSLKEKEVLLKEIHHRVKNNMQVIYSLLNLQAKKITDKTVRAMFEESRDRVSSMALVHEKLYSSEDLAHIDFKEYLRSLVKSIANTYKRHDVAYDLEMEQIVLDVNVGIPCGLIVNELVSNSLKYAFPDGKKGTIKLGINKNCEGYHVLTVADNGIGFPPEVDFRNTLSLGLKLVNVLTGQIRGTIELSRAEGTRFCITFPGSPQTSD